MTRLRVDYCWVILLAGFYPAQSAFGCSCAPTAYAPACQKISSATISFLGTVQKIEPDSRSPNNARARVYRFRVERVYKGLDPHSVEVVVDPDNFTTCQAEFSLGVRYIIFGGKLPGSDTVMTGMCSGSRRADSHQDEVSFLNQFAEGKSQPFVSGRVIQWRTDIGWPDARDSAPIPGANVLVRNASTSVSRRTDLDGAFRFDSLAPGRYTLSADARGFGTVSPYQIELPAIGCVETFPMFSPHTNLSGTLTLESGAPAAKKRVEVVRQDTSGKWYSTYQFWTQTDENGHFQFKELPSGEYLVGYDIWSDQPSQYSPYPTRYFPGVPRREQATVVHLSPQQSVDRISLRLSPPHKPRKIRVDVVWPDGTSPTEHMLQLFNGQSLIANLGWTMPNKPPASHRGVFEFDGYEERIYRVHARYWIDDLGSSVPHDQQRIAITDTKEISAGASTSVRLVLNNRLLASEEH